MGLDVVFGPSNIALHIQVGSARARPLLFGKLGNRPQEYENN